MIILVVALRIGQRFPSKWPKIYGLQNGGLLVTSYTHWEPIMGTHRKAMAFDLRICSTEVFRLPKGLKFFTGKVAVFLVVVVVVLHLCTYTLFGKQ